MKVEFRRSREGEQALVAGQVVCVLHKPARPGGDWWCVFSGGTVVHKNLTHAEARDLVVSRMRTREDRLLTEVRRKAHPVTPVLTAERIPTRHVVPVPIARPLLWVASRVRPELLRCPICGVPLSKVERHMRKVHPERAGVHGGLLTRPETAVRTPLAPAVQPAAQPVKVPPKRLTIMVQREGRTRVVRCPLCRLTVQPVAIWEHIDRAHPGTDCTHWQVEEERRHSRGASTGGSSGGQARKPVEKRKPRGWVEGLATALTHVADGASRPKSQGRAPLDARRKKFRTADRVDPAVRQERSTDATGLYAQRYREGGKFGSYAAHDGYGDEDMP